MHWEVWGSNPSISINTRKDNKHMNPIIQANERLIKLSELKEAHELHDFIKQLDEKYGVDSSDPDNTFGRVPLDDAIIQHGVSNLCYFAKTDVEYWTKKIQLPTHKAIPKANYCIGIDKHGEPQLIVNAANVAAKRIPIEIEEEDIKHLTELRDAYKHALKQVKIKEPDFSTLQDHYFNSPEGRVYYDRMNQFQKDRVADLVLEKQGFASDKHRHIEVAIPVEDVNEEVHDFVVKYYRLSPNKCPYFATTYDGSQAQKYMKQNTLAYQFYQKWNVLHTHNMTLDEWSEMVQDLNELQK